MARPTKYTQKLAAEICRQLSEGKSLRSVCRADKMPDASSVFLWLSENKEFSEQYVRAKEESADAQHEDLLELGDEAIHLSMTLRGPQASAAVQAVKLKADNLKWSMSKMKPKKYGDKLAHVGPEDGPIQLQAVEISFRESPNRSE